MHKLSWTFFVSILFSLLTKGQTGAGKKFDSKIDSITSAEQIEQLLVSIDPSFTTFRVNDSSKFLNNRCHKVSDSLHCVPWFKADFDNNGYTDIMITGGWDDHVVLCILDSGNNRFGINRLTRKIFQSCTFPVLKKIGDDNLILYYSFNETKNDSIKGDTLIYKFGDFINYNSLPAKYGIQKIAFVTNACLGQCPQFELRIDSNRNAQYNAIHYNKQYGNFKSVIDENSFSQFTQLLCYLDFPNLENDYTVSWENDKSCTLTIVYDNGKVKTIHDSGLHGTFGLERVYQILFGWRNDQQWKKILPGDK